MCIAIYAGDFDDLSGGVVFSWFISNPQGPTVFNVSGRRRWSKLSEWLRPKPPVARQFGMAG